MRLVVDCLRCGKTFQTASPIAKWCSEACRKAASRAAPQAPAEPMRQAYTPEDEARIREVCSCPGIVEPHRTRTEAALLRVWGLEPLGHVALHEPPGGSAPTRWVDPPDGQPKNASSS
ncbi:hypothetical protein GCM10027053_03910 [Intrasporangium mesophilum]